MPNERIRVATGTPKASKRDQARFRVLIEPEERTRRWSHGMILIGDSLDAPAQDRCLVRRFWFKDGRGGIQRTPCGSYACPTCVVDALTDRVGRAWAYWRGTANVFFQSDDDKNGDPVSPATRSRERKELGIVMSGPNATVGALSVPFIGRGAPDFGEQAEWGRYYFWPGDDIGYGRSGDELDALLVHLVREVMLPGPRATGGGPPSESFGFIPNRVADEIVARIAEEVGMPFAIKGRTRWAVDRCVVVTDEMRHDFVTRLRTE